MNGRNSMEHEFVTIGGAIPRLVSAEPAGARMVKVAFDDGVSKTVDLAPAIQSKRFFIPLRDNDALFNSFRISQFRDSIEWNDELDASALWLHALPSVSFTNDEFSQAMKDLGMSLDGMAEALQVSRRLIARYRKDTPIPRHIALATRYLVEHHVK